MRACAAECVKISKGSTVMGGELPLFMHSAWEGTRLTASGLFVCILCLYVCGCGCMCVRAPSHACAFYIGSGFDSPLSPSGGFRDSGRMTFSFFFFQPSRALALPARCSDFCTRAKRNVHSCTRGADARSHAGRSESRADRRSRAHNRARTFRLLKSDFFFSQAEPRSCPAAACSTLS